MLCEVICGVILLAVLNINVHTQKSYAYRTIFGETLYSLFHDTKPAGMCREYAANLLEMSNGHYTMNQNATPGMQRPCPAVDPLAVVAAAGGDPFALQCAFRRSEFSEDSSPKDVLNQPHHLRIFRFQQRSDVNRRRSLTVRQ
jgi:hypothetical protein